MSVHGPFWVIEKFGPPRYDQPRTGLALNGPDQRTVCVPTEARWAMGGVATELAGKLRGRLPAARVLSIHAQRVASRGPLNHLQIRAMSRDATSEVNSIAKQLVAKRSPEDVQRIAEIEQYREYLTSSGAASRHDVPVQRMVALARVASKRSRWAGLIFDLVVALKPARVLEMGTAIGISGAYVAAGLDANGYGELVTVESSARHCEIACETFADLGVDHRVTIVKGRFDKVLDGLVDTRPRFDLVFKDGDHSEATTVGWFDSLTPRLASTSSFLLDDIRRDKGMKAAWNQVKQRDVIATSVDFFGMGLVLLTSQPDPPARSYRYGIH